MKKLCSVLLSVALLCSMLFLSSISSSADTTYVVSSVPYSRAAQLPSGPEYHYYEFTPTETAIYSAWTIDTIVNLPMDPMIEVLECYGNTTIVHTSDDDSGHGVNACVTLELEAGVTYQFAITDYYSEGGVYIFILQKGLPMSGSERQTYQQAYIGNYQTNNNCYTYALTLRENPLTNSLFGYKGVDPGTLGNYAINPNFTSIAMAKTNMLAAVRADLVALGGSTNDFYEVSAETMVPEDYYKVTLLVRLNTPDDPYHWIRHTSDLNGAWAHKQGSLPVSTTEDNAYYAGNGIIVHYPIYVPEDCAFNTYLFAGYYALKPPAGSMTHLETNSVPPEESVMSVQNEIDLLSIPQKTNLLLTDFAIFKKDVTTRSQVLDAVGRPHLQMDSGAHREIYRTSDSYYVSVHYEEGRIQEVRILTEEDLANLDLGGLLQ